MVDSPYLSLNISREILQHDRQLKIIAKSLEKKINTTEMNDFYIDQIVYKQNACGCININNMWFIYKKMDEYSIIVLGDVDGDGILSLFDIMKVANYIYINNNILSDVYLYASDYNKDKNYDLKDIMKIAYDLYG